MMKATDAYRRINNSPIKGIVLYYTEQLLANDEVKLSSVISQIQTGKTPPKANPKYYSSQDINWFKPSDIGYGKYLINSKEKFSNIAVTQKKGTIYSENTLLMIGIGGGVGRVSVLKEKGSSNQQITGISFKKNVSAEYAYYYYLVREVYIKSKAKSMSFPILNQSKIKELTFKYPSLEEQNKFVKFIDNCWNSFLDNKIPDFEEFEISTKLKNYSLKQFKAIKLDSNIKKTIKYELKLISQLKQSILQEAIQGKLTEDWRKQNPNIEPASELLKRIKAEKAQLIKEKKINKEKSLPPITENEIPFKLPLGWVWCRLGEVSNYLNGKGFSSSDFKKENGIKCIKITNAGVGEIIETDDTLPFEFEKKYSSYLVYENDIVIALTRPYIADGLKVSLCPSSYDKSLLNQRVAVVRAYADIQNNYIYNYFRTKFVLDGYKREFDSSGQQPNLKTEHITNLIFPLAPIEEQKEIVKKVETLIQKCQVLEQEIKSSEANAEILMQAVLKEAYESKKVKETKVVKLATKPTNVDYYKRTLLASEIVWQLHKEPTLGHLKLQKLMYLAQESSKMQLPTNFLQQVAGPYDPRMARSIDKQLKIKKWFEYKKTELLKFKPLEKAGTHKTDFDKFFANEKDSIQYIIDTFKTAKSESVEIVGTLYACWKKLIAEKQIVSDKLISKRFYEWSEEKAKFEKNRIITALRWMETKGIVPEKANA